jgi:hypothetical protein
MSRNLRKCRRQRWISALGLIWTLALCLAAPAAAAGSLAFSHADGTPIEFSGQPRAWCGPWSPEVGQRSVHVELRQRHAVWEMRGVLADLHSHPRVHFPNDFVSDHPHGALLFVAAPGGIETSSAEEEGSGSISFAHLGCRRGSLLEFTVEATLGSELFEGETVSASGTYRGRIGAAPALIPARHSRR